MQLLGDAAESRDPLAEDARQDRHRPVILRAPEIRHVLCE
ncbi:MAG: hypothetical protein AVDCRST_MAG30-1232 [uncultured Solirubrobacteraceae bacterium]|uniref:Uncharacterized protein n=1 Tax=uncultured Solirubrobacteraceae bacterium TaxID=1162706 RepID=A0A6J4S8Z6_9ACTN|nr:MAG: hypothetical protein AVDCRST_MAG30-1232 [uncultured Solirubrobacteraceae bacterium]